MKRVLFFLLLPALQLGVAAGRTTTQTENTEKTNRPSRIVGPRLASSDSLLTGKKALDKRFFGDFNARMEYLFEPSFSETMGLRVFKRGTDTAYRLEVKRVVNYKEVEDQVQKEFPMAGTTVADLAGLSEKEQRERLTHNKEVIARRAQESLKRYKIRTTSVPISDRFAERLFETTKTTICSTVPEEKRYSKEGYEIITVINDGAHATFRCAEDESKVWTLQYHESEGQVRVLSDLFRAMIADVEAGRFDEAKYREALN